MWPKKKTNTQRGSDFQKPRNPLPHKTHVQMHLQIVKSIFIDLEEKLFEIRDHRFHERKDDVVRVKNVYVGSGLAQLDTRDGCGLCHGFWPVRSEGLFDDVNELLLPNVFGRAWRAGVSVVDFFQNVWSQNLKPSCL